MKKNTLLLCFCLLLFSAHTFYAQEKSKSIILDFQEREFIKMDDVKKGEFFKIKIKNLNTYLYKVEVASEDSTITTSLPSNLFAVLDLANLNTLAAALPQAFRGLVEAQIDSSDKRILELNALMNNNSFGLLNKINIDLLKFKDTLIAHQKTYNEIQTRILEYLVSVQTEEEGVLFNFPKNENIGNIRNDFKKLNTAIFKNHSSMNASYIKFLEVFNSLSDNDKKNLKKGKDEINAIYKELDKKYTELENFTSANTLKKVWESIVVVFNNKAFKYESLPIERTGDLTEVTIKITPRDSTSRLHAYTTKFKFPEEESHWSISSGFYVTNNPDENFSPKATTDSNGVTTYDLIEEDNGDYELGISAMFRYHWKLDKTKATYWHVGLGTGVNIGADVRPRVLLGTGLAFGKKDKFIIDVGGIYMFYDKISNAVDLTGNTAVPEDYTVSASKIQLYFSLGYTISLD